MCEIVRAYEFFVNLNSVECDGYIKVKKKEPSISSITNRNRTHTEKACLDNKFYYNDLKLLYVFFFFLCCQYLIKNVRMNFSLPFVDSLCCYAANKCQNCNIWKNSIKKLFSSLSVKISFAF